MDDNFMYSQALMFDDGNGLLETLRNNVGSYPEFQHAVSPADINVPSNEAGNLVLGALELPLNDSELEFSESLLRNITDSDGGLKLPSFDPVPDLDCLTNDQHAPDAGSSKTATIKSNVKESHAGTGGILLPDEEAVSFEDWDGPYKFKVSPMIDEDKVKKKKVMYSIEQRKLFCNVGTNVPFKFELDYSQNKKLNNLMIKAFLVYEDNDAVNKAVLRCPSHIENEKRITDASKMERLAHMLRPSDPNPDITYFQHPNTGRCYLLIPLKTPEPGMSYVTRSYCFTCRNSCNLLDLDGKARRAITIAFYLFDARSGKVFGRSHTRVRVCSAPARDFNKEVNSVANPSKKRKSEGDVDSEFMPMTKQANYGPGLTEVSGTPAVPDAVALQRMSVRCTVKAPVNGRSDEDGVSSSQETVYSCDESANKINLRDFLRNIRWILKQKNADNPALRIYSKNVYNAIKLTQDLCDGARGLFEAELQAKQVGKSPDGGFHDN